MTIKIASGCEWMSKAGRVATWGIAPASTEPSLLEIGLANRWGSRNKRRPSIRKRFTAMPPIPRDFETCRNRHTAQ